MYSLLSSFYFRIALLFRFVIFMFLFINCVWLIYLIRKDLRQTIFIWTWGTHCFNSIRNVVIIYVSLSQSICLSVYICTHMSIYLYICPTFEWVARSEWEVDWGHHYFSFSLLFLSTIKAMSFLEVQHLESIYISSWSIYIHICTHI